MVRLETIISFASLSKVFKFTFQYGQIRNRAVLSLYNVNKYIYIPVWLDQKQATNLKKWKYIWKFTFQYGQIRNTEQMIIQLQLQNIYIPVWLDQKP